jgi:hypothetical protein
MQRSIRRLMVAACLIAALSLSVEAANPLVLKIPHKEMARRRGDRRNAHAAVFSADDRFVFVGAGDDVVVFRVDDGAPVRWYRIPVDVERQVGHVCTLQLIEDGTKLLAQHWNPWRFAVWEVQALVEGGGAEPFLLFPEGDHDHRQCDRFEVLGSWDAGRLVVFEYYHPKGPFETSRRPDQGPKASRLRLRRWKERAFEPNADVDVSAYGLVYVAKERTQAGVHVAAALGPMKEPSHWHHITVRWEGGRPKIEKEQVADADAALQWLVPDEIEVTQIRRWIARRGYWGMPSAGKYPLSPALTHQYQYRTGLCLVDPLGQRLALGSCDLSRKSPNRPLSLTLVDLKLDRLVATLPTSRGVRAMPLAFSHDANRLVTMTELSVHHRDGTRVLLWDLPSQSTGY